MPGFDVIADRAPMEDAESDERGKPRSSHRTTNAG
jgi:hypothetical protein